MTTSIHEAQYDAHRLASRKAADFGRAQTEATLALAAATMLVAERLAARDVSAPLRQINDPFLGLGGTE